MQPFIAVFWCSNQRIAYKPLYKSIFWYSNQIMDYKPPLQSTQWYSSQSIATNLNIRQYFGVAINLLTLNLHSSQYFSLSGPTKLRPPHRYAGHCHTCHITGNSPISPLHKAIFSPEHLFPRPATL